MGTKQFNGKTDAMKHWRGLDCGQSRGKKKEKVRQRRQTKGEKENPRKGKEKRSSVFSVSGPFRNLISKYPPKHCRLHCHLHRLKGEHGAQCLSPHCRHQESHRLALTFSQMRGVTKGASYQDANAHQKSSEWSFHPGLSPLFC